MKITTDVKLVKTNILVWLSNRNISFNQFCIFGYFQLFTTMFKLLAILSIIKMYARNNVFILKIIKTWNCTKTRIKVLINLNNKSFWYIDLHWPTLTLLIKSLVDWRQNHSTHFRSVSLIRSRLLSLFLYTFSSLYSKINDRGYCNQVTRGAIDVFW